MKLIKINFFEDNISNTTAAENAPDIIVEELKNMHLNESLKKHNYKVFEIDTELNIEINTENCNLDEIYEKIEKDVFAILSDRSNPTEKIVILGGGHSLTYASFKAFAEQNDGAGFVLIDAHPDLLPEYGPEKREDYLRALINEGILLSERLIIVGVRDIEQSEKQFIDLKKIKIFTMKQIYNFGLPDFCDGLMETIRGWPSSYLSIDIDSADPSCAPGTSCIEPGGFSARELIYIVQRLSMIKSIGMIDIMEVNPKKDVNRMTSRLAAKLVNELF